DPATERPAGRVALGGAADVDRAVAAARRAFERYGVLPVADRLALLDRIIAAYQQRMPDLAAAITAEIGAPAWLAEQMQAVLGLVAFQNAREALATYSFSERQGPSRIVKEPIGVCALI